MLQTLVFGFKFQTLIPVSKLNKSLLTIQVWH